MTDGKGNIRTRQVLLTEAEIIVMKEIMESYAAIIPVDEKWMFTKGIISQLQRTLKKD